MVGHWFNDKALYTLRVEFNRLYGTNLKYRRYTKIVNAIPMNWKRIMTNNNYVERDWPPLGLPPKVIMWKLIKFIRKTPTAIEGWRRHGIHGT